MPYDYDYTKSDLSEDAQERLQTVINEVYEIHAVLYESRRVAPVLFQVFRFVGRFAVQSFARAEHAEMRLKRIEEHLGLEPADSSESPAEGVKEESGEAE